MAWPISLNWGRAVPAGGRAMRAHHDTRIAAKAAFASKLRAATIVAATMLLAASAISPARANPVSDFRDEVLTLIFRLAVEPAVDAFSGTDLGATTDQLGQDAFDGFFDTFNYFYDGDFTTYFADVLDVPDVTGDSISIEAGDTAILLSDHEVSGSGNLDVSGSLFISRLKIEPGTPAFFFAAPRSHPHYTCRPIFRGARGGRWHN